MLPPLQKSGVFLLMTKPYWFVITAWIYINQNPHHSQVTRTAMLKSSCPRMSLSPNEAKRLRSCKVPLDIHTHVSHNGHLFLSSHINKCQASMFSPELAKRYPNSPTGPHILSSFILALAGTIFLTPQCHTCLSTLSTPMFHTYLYGHPYKFFVANEQPPSTYIQIKFAFLETYLSSMTHICLRRHILAFHDTHSPSMAQIPLLWHIPAFTTSTHLLWHTIASCYTKRVSYGKQIAFHEKTLLCNRFVFMACITFYGTFPPLKTHICLPQLLYPLT